MPALGAIGRAYASTPYTAEATTLLSGGVTTYYAPQYAPAGGSAGGGIAGDGFTLTDADGVVRLRTASRTRQVSGETQVNGTPTAQRVTVSYNGGVVRETVSTPALVLRDLVAGSYEITVHGNGAKRTETWGPTAVGSPGVMTLTGSLAACSSGVAYSSGLTVAGGWGDPVWDIVGSLPTGLGFSTSTGLITGTTTATGTYGLDIGASKEGIRRWKRVTLTVT